MLSSYFDMGLKVLALGEVFFRDHNYTS